MKTIQDAACELYNELSTNSKGNFNVKFNKKIIKVYFDRTFKGTIPVKYNGYDVDSQLYIQRDVK